jgi:hypothetical protein
MCTRASEYGRSACTNVREETQQQRQRQEQEREREKRSERNSNIHTTMRDPARETNRVEEQGFQS